MFSRCPSLGGCSLSMSCVRATPAWPMADVVSDTGPSSPMFSPAAVQCTPAAVSRSPIAGSPGHWWDRPQPPAMVRLCWDALWSRPDENVRAARPAWARAWLSRATASSAASPCCLPPPDAPPERPPEPEDGALAVADTPEPAEPAGAEADADGAAEGAGALGGGLAGPPGILALTI